jgi:putative tryptophan/tyrosine transport system substrate-binding protein
VKALLLGGQGVEVLRRPAHCGAEVGVVHDVVAPVHALGLAAREKKPSRTFSGKGCTLARPGGNITGLATNAADLAGKRLELLRAIVPRLRRVALLWHPANPSNPIQLKGARAAARTLGVQLELVSIQGPGDFDAPAKAVRGADGLLPLESPLFTTYRARLAELAARNRLPAIFSQREYVEAGGLMSYGTDFHDLYRRAGRYVDKILKGAKPADLPVEQPTKFELVINLKTAKALGLTIPPSVLGRADQVIE